MELHASLISIDESELWSDSLRELNCDVFSHAGWIKAAAEMDGGRGFLVVARRGGESIAAIPLLARSIRGGREDVGSPYGYPGLCHRPNIDSKALAQALGVMCEELGARGFVSCFIRGNPIFEQSCDLGIGELVHHGSTVSIALDKPMEARMSGLASGHRYEIRRTAKAGVVVRGASASVDWQAFRGLYEDAMRRLEASANYIWPDAHWDQLRQLSEVGEATLLMAFNEQQPLAGAVFLHMPRTSLVHYHLAAASRANPKLHPGKLLLWEAQEYFAQFGYSRLHLGGGLGGRADSLFQFKAGFSADRHAFFTRRIILDKATYQQLTGSVKTDFFPAYRLPSDRGSA